MQKLTNEDLISIGFKPHPFEIIGNPVSYDLGRRRFINVSNAGTPNEFICISERDNPLDPREVTGLVVLRNYDYDGYTHISQIALFIDCIKTNFEKHENAI